MRTRFLDQWPTLLVAALAGTFGVALLHVTGLLAAAIAADDVTGGSATVALMLGIVATVFIVIAVYVSAIVTANTVSTVVAGRTRLIALLRLIGSSARAQRARSQGGAPRRGSSARPSASSRHRGRGFALRACSRRRRTSCPRPTTTT